MNRSFKFSRPAFNRGVEHGLGTVLVLVASLAVGGGFVLVWKMWL